MKIISRAKNKIIIASLSILAVVAILASYGFGSGYMSLGMITGTPNGTKFLRDDLSWQTPAVGGGGDGAPIWIAADNATAKEKAWAAETGGSTCDGTADEVDIETVLASNTEIWLSSGTFTFADDIEMTSLSNITIHGVAGTIISLPNVVAFTLTTCDNITFTGLEILTTSGTANIFRVYGCTDLTFENSVFHDFSNCFTVSAGAAEPNTTWSDRIHVRNCEFYNIDYEAILIHDGVRYMDIDHCSFKDAATGITGTLYMIANTPYAQYNTSIPGTEHISITNCEFNTQDRWDCVDLHQGTDILIDNNNFLNVARCAITVHVNAPEAAGSAQNWTVTNNNIDGAGVAIACNIDSSISYNFSVTNILIANNVIRNVGWAGTSPLGNGIVVECGDSQGTMTNVNISDNTIDTSYVTSGYAYPNGIKVSNSGGGTLTNVVVNSNVLNLTSDDTVYPDGISFESIVNGQITNNTVKGISTGTTGYLVKLSASDDSLVTGNHLSTAGTAIYSVDGDDMLVTSNRIVGCTTPVSFNHANVVRPVITGNNWEGCTNDTSTASATNPRIASNIDKTGAWSWGDNVQ